ncbi:pentatricopeptide repeat-containing protein At2g29760, chloroplastic [Elaeis guineensis]|uniref:Pentatricopeptide repeat-containing protein At1g08070, chloroplastic n=1 Tax=Elaeis guineensis var. tenera TaxID=51953 RepID=A0A6I9Q841_ELAGV|nr:pentatricopeptide repeat-containing protein At1g08070, chloroplastic [Elaeis guineensis]
MASTTLCTCACSHDLRQWNRVIKLRLSEGNAMEAIIRYTEAQELGVIGDNFTFPLLFKAASNLSSLLAGSTLHGQAMKSGYSHHAFVQTSLINMYSSFGFVDQARQVFDGMSQKDIVAWNSILDAYATCGQMDECIKLFDSMPLKDQVSFNILTFGYANIGKADEAEQIFNSTPSRDAFTWNLMISSYVKAGRMDLAHGLCDRMPEKNVVSWNTIIAGYLQSRSCNKVLDLFYEMQAEGFKPNYVTLLSALSACAHMGSLDMGREIHICAQELGLSLIPHVATALVDMYTKCGSIEEALRVFYKTQNKDIYCWNSIICGLALHGYGKASLEIFEDMQSRGIKPDDITFIGLLSGCSHAGLVNEGLHLFECMESQYGLSPKSEHYGCVVDLLGRAGCIGRAYEIVKGMPFEPGVTVLGALLGACIVHRNVEVGEVVAKSIADRGNQMSSGEYMMLASMYTMFGQWEEARRWRELMNENCVTKEPGCSMIEVSGKVYGFLAGDTT